MQDMTATSTLKKSRRHRQLKFSLENKQQFYQAWKKSGLSRNQFCRDHKLTVSSFCGWVNQFEAEKVSSVTPSSTSSFVPLVMKAVTSTTVLPTAHLNQKPISLELKLPNGFSCSFSGALEANFIAQLIQELSHGVVNTK